MYDSLEEEKIEEHKNNILIKKDPFICIKCNKNFSTKRHLLDHISSFHDKLKPFICH